MATIIVKLIEDGKCCLFYSFFCLVFTEYFDDDDDVTVVADSISHTFELVMSG